MFINSKHFMPLVKAWSLKQIDFYVDIRDELFINTTTAEQFALLLLIGITIPFLGTIPLILYLTGMAFALPLDLIFLSGCIIADLALETYRLFKHCYFEITSPENPKHDRLVREENGPELSAVNDVFMPQQQIVKDFIDSFKPYKYGTAFEVKRTVLQPIYGLVNIAIGLKRILVDPIVNFGKAVLLFLSIIGNPDAASVKLFKSASAIFSIFTSVANGASYLLRGSVQLLFTPLSWTIRPLLRLAISQIIDENEKPCIVNNAGIQARLEIVRKAQEVDSEKGIAKGEQACNEIHRKFSKSLERGEDIGKHDLTEDVERKLFNEIKISSAGEGIDRRTRVNNYLRLFAKNHEDLIPPSVANRQDGELEPGRDNRL